MRKIISFICCHHICISRYHPVGFSDWVTKENRPIVVHGIGKKSGKLIKGATELFCEGTPRHVMIVQCHATSHTLTFHILLVFRVVLCLVVFVFFWFLCGDGCRYLCFISPLSFTVI